MPRLPPLLFALCAVTVALPARPAAAQPRGEDLRISVITFGPHEHPFFKFGHNALLVEHASGQGYVYNWGMFDFSSPALIPKFILGRSMYWLARTQRDPTIAAYIADDRTVEVQELDLTAQQRAQLFERLEDNARPQNRYYLYDYFFDNCSTRVRDAVDGILGGKLRAAATAPSRLSFRGHALRLTADLPWEYVALYFVLGSTADRPMDRFGEGFIPMELRDMVRQVRLPPVPGGDGADRPLVKEERRLYQAKRQDPPLDPPRRWPLFLLAGALPGAALALAGWRAPGRRGARLGLGIGVSLLGLVGGLLGALLIFLWGFTNHRATHANANIMQAAPFALGLVVYGIKLARDRGGALRKAFLLAAGAAALSLLGLLLKLVGLVPQDNLPIVAFFLPLWAGMTLGLWLAGGARPAPR